MSDDVEHTLEALDARLRALQDDLEGGQILHPSRGQILHPSTPDPLDQFGVELRRLATELVAAWERVAALERQRPAAGPAAPRTIVLEADADLHALATLERALAASPEVREVGLRAYTDGHATIAVELS